MALPVTRNTTYAATDPVKSADLNDIQDQIIAVANGRRNAYKKVISLTMASEGLAGGDLTISGSRINLFQIPGSAVVVNVGLDLEVGSRLLEVVLFASKTAGGVLSCDVLHNIRTDPGLGATSLGLSSTTVTGEFSIGPALNHTVLEDNRYYLVITFPLEISDIRYIEVSLDKP